MKNQNTNLLPRMFSKRVALIWKMSKIKLRFPRRFLKLAISLSIVPILLGYYPAFAVPPVKRAVAHAENPPVSEQKMEITMNSFSEPVNLPHPGYLSTKFSPFHPGIDIAAGLGMPIHPITSGEVSIVGRDLFGLGNYVEVAHENGFKSKYAHMGKIFVKKGDFVGSQNLLGEVGMTGNTSGPHTHLEVTLNGKYIDPLGLLPEVPRMPFIATR